MWLCIAFSLSSRAQFHVWRHALRQETGDQLPPPGGKAAYRVSWTGVKTIHWIIPFVSTETKLWTAVRRVVACVTKTLEQMFSDAPEPVDSQYSSIVDQYETFEYFPGFPVTHGSGRYPERERRRIKVCKKASVSHCTLSPGLFFLYCKHGTCLGFAMMRIHEGPHQLLDLMCRRFRALLPRATLIYDNACNTHHYCLAREPVLFRGTRFVVDRFHFNKNHTACSRAYCVDEYPDLKTVNTELAEQQNSRLRKLSRRLVCMTQDNVMNTLKHTVLTYNAERKAQLR
ncbi:hypothetical protein BaRGS_00011172 [Batillaria attramentaria]|uniref:Transposase n=1 Tax=Batillaria attramentaria TaxID=370345 RepID=A0ABD0LES0_9CAEN